MAIILGTVDRVVFIQCSCMQYIRATPRKKKMPPRIVKSREDSLITNAQDSIHQKMFSATKKLRPNGYQPPPLNTPSAILRRPQAPF